MNEKDRLCVRINCGSDQEYVDREGRRWQADDFFAGGQSIELISRLLTGLHVEHYARTLDSALYQTARDLLRYDIPVPPGSYTVALHFVEDDTRISAPGQRLFDLYVNGVRIPDVDVFGETGGWHRVLRKTVEVDAPTGSIRISKTVNLPPVAIAALEVAGTYEAPRPVPISPVSDVRCVAGDRRALLLWEESAGADSYVVYRVDSEGRRTVGVRCIPGGRWCDESVVNGCTYAYTVAPLFEGIEGPESELVTTTPVESRLEPWAHLPREKVLDVGMGEKVRLVLIPPGQFAMGSPGLEAGRFLDERLHLVTITRPFYYGRYPITQSQWEVVMGTNPSHPIDQGRTKPVNSITHSDALEFCRRVANQSGLTVRLPTEAEFEFACRAGRTTSFFFGDDATRLGEYCWYQRGRRISHDVGLLFPNPYGLYDIHGNVWEWVADHYEAEYANADAVSMDPEGPEHGDRNVLRGGCSFNGFEWQRSAARHSILPGYTDNAIGMRVVVEAERG